LKSLGASRSSANRNISKDTKMPAKLNYQDKVIVVSGAGGGLGKA
jgi:3-oxoacyl-ACP reductase-like protein